MPQAKQTNSSKKLKSKDVLVKKTRIKKLKEEVKQLAETLPNEEPGFLKRTWNKIKSWVSFLSGWKAAGTIFFARLAMLGGGVTTWFATLDWSPLWTLFQAGTGFTWKQLLGIGVSVAGAGLMLEIVRRSGAKDLPKDA